MRQLLLVLGIAVFAVSSWGLSRKDHPSPLTATTLTVRLPNPKQQLFYVDEVMPVRPGPLTLYFPKYIPGDHAPDGPIEAMMGLEISANGQRVAWLRDEVDMFTFHLTVPAAASQIEIRFQMPAPDRITPNLMGLEWNQVALYRADMPSNRQVYQPTLVIPDNWQYSSALVTQARTGGSITFKPVPFNTLVDSPVIAGEYFRQIDLTPPTSTVHRYLDMVGDTAAALDISGQQVENYRNLIQQAQDLFHSHHYDNYHLLLTLSDYVSVGGLEHHQSSDDRARSGARTFADPDRFMLDASLLPHEYTHSWNGKFMRPAGLWQPNFEDPERAQMLWIYEGLTVYLGDVLTVRSGLWSADTWRDVVAYRAADMEDRTGRDWRPLLDTTRGAQLVYGSTEAWSNWRRQTDFYREGQLLWLAVDMKIRLLSHGQRSLDNFAQKFFAVDDGSFITHTYTFADVTHTLGQVQPYDWADYLRTWLNGVGHQVPLLSGIQASGWQLEYSQQRSRYQRALETAGEGELEGRGINAMSSIGLFLDRKGKIEDVLWQGPAFATGLAPGMQVEAIDGHPYSPALLADEIAAAQRSRHAIQITATGDGVTGHYTIPYYGGLRYPHLVRESGTTDFLQRILEPKPSPILN